MPPVDIDSLTRPEIRQIEQALYAQSIPGELVDKVSQLLDHPVVTAVNQMENRIVESLDKLTVSVDRLHADLTRDPTPVQAQAEVHSDRPSAMAILVKFLADHKAWVTLWITLLVGGVPVALEVVSWIAPSKSIAIERGLEDYAEEAEPEPVPMPVPAHEFSEAVD